MLNLNGWFGGIFGHAVLFIVQFFGKWRHMCMGLENKNHRCFEFFHVKIGLEILTSSVLYMMSSVLLDFSVCCCTRCHGLNLEQVCFPPPVKVTTCPATPLRRKRGGAVVDYCRSPTTMRQSPLPKTALNQVRLAQTWSQSLFFTLSLSLPEL